MKKPKSKRGKRRASSSTKWRKRAGDPPQRHDGPRLGLEATIERVVRPEHTLQTIDPNLPAVFSTPSMIGLMEHASVMAVRSELPPGTISVGTRIEVDHLKAVGPGAKVKAWARFVKYRGRFLVFDVEAHSGDFLIGRGRVFRAIVEPRQHHDKAQARVRQ
ncbi:MAG TPA: hotdog domain-containing protein [Candidatus Acidoferrales bacterium]